MIEGVCCVMSLSTHLYHIGVCIQWNIHLAQGHNKTDILLYICTHLKH
jgi:hypothetical protein